VAKTNDEDFEFGDFNMDEFGDDGAGGFGDGKRPNSDRKPISVLAGSFKDGIKSHVTDRSNQIQFLKNALPSGYQQTVDAVDQTVSGVKSLYDTAVREAAPVIKDLKKGVKMALPAAKSILPKGLADKLEAWTTEVAQSSSNFDPEENEITMSLGGIFSAIGEDQKQRDIEAQTQQAARDYAQAKQTGDTIKQLIGVQYNTGRLVSYQDQITSKFQQKSLELQYRQYFTTRKMLNVFEQHLELSKVSFETISKNTALPELVKERDSEIAKDMLKRKFLGTVTDPMSKWFQGAGHRVINKAKADITRFFKDVGASVGDIMSMAESASESMESMGGGESGRDMALDMAGSTAGSGFANKVGGYIARNPLANWFKKINGFEAGNQIARRTFMRAPEILNQFMKEQAGSGGAKGTVASWLEGAVGKHQRSDVVQTSMVDSLEQRMVFDLQTKRTITDVIPGWLAKIHNELVITRKITKDPSDLTAEHTEELKYSWEKGDFETSQAARSRIHGKVYDKDKLKRARDHAIKWINKVDPNQSDDDTAPLYGLSDRIRDKLRRYLEKEAMAGRTLNLDYLVSPTAPLMQDLGLKQPEVDELQSFLKTAEHLGYDSRVGEVESNWDSSTNMLKGVKQGMSGAFKRQARITDLTEINVNLRDDLPSYHQELINSAGLGGGNAEMMRKMGLLRRDTKTDTYSMDENMFLDTLHDEAAIPGKTKGGKGAKHADGGHITGPARYFGVGGQALPGRPRVNGLLSGPGTGISDSIPAELSNGEFVVRSAAVRQPHVLPLLQGINALGGATVNPKGKDDTGVATVEDGIAAMATRLSTDIQATNQLLKEMFADIRAFAGKPILTFNIPDLPDFDMSKFNLSNLSFGETGMLKVFRGAQSAGKWAFGAATDLGKGIWNRSGRIANGALDIGADLVGAGVKGVKKLYAGAEGIYVKGSAKVLLSIQDLEVQNYIDVNTGKVIKTLKDVTGAVTDGAGKVVITAEEYAKGLYYSRGKKLLAWMSGVGNTIKGIAKGTWSALSIIPASLKSVGSFALDVLDMPDDIYVEGDDPWQPRLEARVFKLRGYRLFTTKEVVTRISQITVPIIGADDNIVLSTEDFKKGLVDVNHKPIRGFKGRILNGLKEGANTAIQLFKTGIGHAQDILFGMLGGVKNFFTGRSWGISLFSSTETMVTRLEQIYSLLNDRLPGTPSALPSDFGRRRPPPVSDDPAVNAELAANQTAAGKASKALQSKAKEMIANSPTGSRIADMINRMTATLTGDQSAELEAYLKEHANPDGLESDKPATADQFVGPMPQGRMARMFSGFKELWADEHRLGALPPANANTASGRITGIINRATGLVNGDGEDQNAAYQAYLKEHANPEGLDDPESMMSRIKGGIQSGIQAVQSDFKDRAEYNAYLRRTAALNPTREGESRINTGSHVANFINGITNRINGDGSDVGVPDNDKADNKASFSDRLKAYIDTSETAELLRGTEIYQTLFNDPELNQAKRTRLIDKIAAVDGDLIRRAMDGDALVKQRVVQLVNAVNTEGTIESLERYLNYVCKLKDPAASPGQSMVDSLKDKAKGAWDSLTGTPKDAVEQPRNDDEAYQQWLEMADAHSDTRNDSLGSKVGQRARTWGWRAKENLAADGQSILDAFRKSSGMDDFGKGRLRDFDVESMFRNKDTLAANKAKKAADAQAKLDAKDRKARDKVSAKINADAFKSEMEQWNTKASSMWSLVQQGLLDKDAYDLWAYQNPSPKDAADRARAEFKRAADAKSQAARALDDAERKTAKDDYKRAQAEWEATYGQMWGAMARGDLSKEALDQWMAANPSPKSIRAQARKKKGMWGAFKDILKPDYRDKDGDGDRDGSAEDQKEAKEKSLLQKMQEGYAKGKNGETRTMRERMDDMMSKVPGIFDAAGGLLGKVVGALGPLGQVLMMAKSAGVFALLGGAKVAGGVVSAARWAKNGGIASTVVRGAMMAGSASTAIMGAASSMAVMGATALGAIVASPLLIPGLIIAGTAAAIYAGVKVYDYYNQDDAPIGKFRMAQYGYEVDDKEHVEKLIELETRCLKIVSVGKGQQAQLRAGETAESLMAIFKVDTNDKEAIQRWITWFVKRFKPVFLAHVTMLYDLVGKSDISKADKLLTSQQRLTYLNAVHFRGADTPYNVFASPFADDDEVDVYNSTWSNDVDDAYEDAVDWTKSNASDTDKALASSKDAKKEKEKPKAEKTVWEKTKDAVQGAKDKVQNALTDAIDAFDNDEKTAWLRDKTTDLIGWGDRVLTSMGNGYEIALSRKTSTSKNWSSKKSAQFDALIAAAAAKYGIDESALRGMAYIESKGDARAYHSGSGAAGIFQFTKNTGAKYGLIDPVNGQDYRFDEAKNIDAGARLYVDNMRELKDKYGVNGEPYLMYLRHQQGVGGFQEVMRAAKSGIDPATIMLKASSKGPVYSLRKSMDSNGGTGLSVPQFLEYWRGRYQSETLAANATSRPAAPPPAPKAAPTVAAATLAKPATNKPAAIPGTSPTTPASKPTPSQSLSTATPAYAPGATIPGSTIPAGPSTSGDRMSVTGVSGGDVGGPEMTRLAAIGKRAYRLKDDGVKMQLSPAFNAVIMALFGDYYERTRKTILVTSAYRSPAEQKALYEDYCRGTGPMAARPGKSRHESGNAIDISSEVADQMDTLGLLKKYKLNRPYLNRGKYTERWHIEMAGGPAADVSCSDTALYIQPAGAPAAEVAVKAAAKAKDKATTPMAKALAKPKPDTIPSADTKADPTPTADAPVVAPAAAPTPERSPILVALDKIDARRKAEKEAKAAADAAAATAPVAAIEPAIETATPAAVPIAAVDDVVPEDILRSQDRSTTAAQTAAMEQQRQDATVSTATGIDGAVELLRSQLKLTVNIDATLTDIHATLKRMALTPKVAPATTPAPNAAKASVTRPNMATTKETRTPPVSVSRS
jgi:hypothetical protein